MARPITIRRSLVISFVLVVGVLALMLLGSTFFSARTAAEEQAARLIERKLREIERSGQQYFQPVESILAFASAWRAKAQCNTDEDLQGIFDTLVTASPQIAAVRIEPFGVFQEADFEDDAVRWTKPHGLEGPFGLGMSAYTIVDLPSGERALVAVDVPLDAISRFTMAYDVTPSTRVLTLYREQPTGGDGDGPLYSVVGLPREERFASPAERAKALLRLVRDLGLEYVDDALAAYRARGAGDPQAPVSFMSGGERWWAGFRQYALDADVHMADAVFVPERDLIGGSARFRWYIVAASGVALLLAILLAMVLARRAVEPIEELVRHTERLRRGDFSEGERIRSGIEEVQRLAEAHEEMRVGLRELRRLEHELEVAHAVQAATFPTRMPRVPGYALFGSSRPAEDTGGDTYDLVGLRRSREPGLPALTQDDAEEAVLLLADATGHGMGPALSVSQVRAMLRMALRLDADLVGVVREMNEQLCADLPKGRFISAWFGYLDPRTHTITTFSAGQGPILLYRAAQDRFEHGSADAPPLGLMPIDVMPKPPLTLAQRDVYVVLSDGFHEMRNAEDEPFGLERVEEVLREHAHESPEDMAAALYEAVRAFAGDVEAEDDRTIVIVKRLA